MTKRKSNLLPILCDFNASIDLEVNWHLFNDFEKIKVLKKILLI